MSELFCAKHCDGEYSNVGHSITVDLSAWDTSKVTNMRSTFERAGWNAPFIPNINNWNTASVTNMERTFFATGNSVQDGPNLAGWDTSKVTTMKELYFAGGPGATALAGWDTSRVTSFRSMFNQNSNGLATQDISGWDTSKATSILGMFLMAQDFNSDIGKWDTSKVTTMEKTFEQASLFNSDISRWDTSKVTDCVTMFVGATAFNQELGWCFAFAQPASFAAGSGCAVSGGDDCGVAFRPDGDCPCVTPPHQFDPGVDLKNAVALWLEIGADEACQEYGPIEDWDVSKVTDMSELFCASGCVTNNDLGAASFDADLGKWDTGRVTTMESMFQGAAAFDANIGGWNTAKVTTMNAMFQDASAFNLGQTSTPDSVAEPWFWDISSVNSMSHMFAGASAFNQDLSEWVVPSSIDAATGIAGLFAGATAFNQELGWCFAFAQPAGFAGDSGCVDEASGLADDCGVAFCPPSDGGSDGGGSDGGPGDGADGGATTGCTCGTLAVEVTPGPGSRRLTSARNGPFLSQLVVHGVRSRPPDRRRDATRRTPRSVGFDG